MNRRYLFLISSLAIVAVVLAVVLPLTLINNEHPQNGEPVQYPMEVREAVVEEAMAILETRGFWPEVVAGVLYGTDIFELHFYGKADSEAVEIVQSVIDNLAPGLPLEIVECEAVKIAKQQVPAEVVARDAIAAGFRHELGLHGTWFVTFVNVNMTPSELGWEENENTHFKPESTIPGEENIPKDTYRNVTIYIDADTGNVTAREANNELFLGGPGSFPKCDP